MVVGHAFYVSLAGRTSPQLDGYSMDRGLAVALTNYYVGNRYSTTCLSGTHTPKIEFYMHLALQFLTWRVIDDKHFIHFHSNSSSKPRYHKKNFLSSSEPVAGFANSNISFLQYPI